MPFVGREGELEELMDRLQDPAVRLLTLAGPGGIGKTRLATEAAAKIVSSTQEKHFPDGVRFVALAPVQSSPEIVPAIANAIGFPFSGVGEGGHKAEPRQQLLDYLRPRKIMLVMDSFEHLLTLSASVVTPKGARWKQDGKAPARGEAVGMVADILSAARDVKLLVTSRVKLNIQGEHIFPVPGLDYPVYDAQVAHTPGSKTRRRQSNEPAQYDAIKLFIQAARQAQPGFCATAADLAQIARICQLVDGMPLGILLAAAWIQMLTPAEIAIEIRKSLDFLEAEWPDLPHRQRSMRATFDQSWKPLSEREQKVLQSISVFRGGFTREAVEEVTASSLRDLKALVDKSFLRRGPAGRYQVHELLRHYAADKLATAPSLDRAAKERHSVYYIAALQQWAQALKSPRQHAALREMEMEHANISASWQRAVESAQVDLLGQGMEGLELFYRLSGRHEEGEAALQSAARTLEESVRRRAEDKNALQLWARALVWQSKFTRRLGHGGLAAQLQQQAKALLDGPELVAQDTRFERAHLLQSLGHRVLMADYERGRRLQEQALVLFRQLDETWRAAGVLHDLGRAAQYTGAIEEARERYEEGLTLCQNLGHQLGIAQSLAGLAMVNRHEGRFGEAVAHARRAISRFREHCSAVECCYGLDVLGNAFEGAGQFDKALGPLEECLAIHLDLARRHYVAFPHAALSRVNLHLGRYGAAKSHAQTGLAMAKEAGLRFAEGDTLRVLGSVALVQRTYAEAGEYLMESVSVYRDIGHQHDLSRSNALLAYAEHGPRRLGRVRGYLARSLRQAMESRAVLSLLWALPATALLLARQGEDEHATELYSLATRYPFVAQSRWFADVAGNTLDEAAASLPAERVAVLRERGRARDLKVTAAELLAELSA
jgi:predicted ATPase